MQTLVVAAAVHKAAGELVDDYNLSVLNNVVNITLHNAVGADCLIYMVGNRNIFGIVEVFNMEILLRLLNARGGKGRGVRLFIHNIVAVIIGVLVARLVVHFLYLYHLKA